MSDLSKPNTITETYLAALTGDYTGAIPAPVTRIHEYLAKICENGIEVAAVKALAEEAKTSADTANTEILVIKDNAVGQKTSDGGEVFNSYSSNTAGVWAHAEGGGTTASGDGSHAEGGSTTASGNDSHAEGHGTTASGRHSHTEGYYTKASSNDQHVQGRFNVEDTEGKFAFIIGNGRSDYERSNAIAIDWNGLIYPNNSDTGIDLTSLSTEIDGVREDLNDLQGRTSEIENKVELIVKKEAKIYGFRINPNEADPYEAVVYLADAVGMTPAKMGAESFDYGSWRDAFFMPRPCMVKYDGTVDYYLNPNNYKEKEDGSASDVANADYEGNAMMEFPKIWYKFEEGSEEGEGYFYCSNVKPDDTYHCWCNINSNDEETDHFYMAIYNGTGTDKLRSLSGVQLTPANGNGNTTGQQEIDRALRNNTTDSVEWYTEVWSDRLLLNALHVLISKSLDTQGSFGQGISSGSQTAKEAYVTGTLDDKGLFFGDATGTATAVKTFGIENFWSLVWHRVAGCISVDNVLKTKLTYGKADGSDVIGYNSTGNGYITETGVPTTDGYASKMKYSERGFMTKAVAGSTNKFYCDYFYQSSGTRSLLVGGSSAVGAVAGAFYFSLGYAFSHAGWSVAASLSLKPLLKKGV